MFGHSLELDAETARDEIDEEESAVRNEGAEQSDVQEKVSDRSGTSAGRGALRQVRGDQRDGQGESEKNAEEALR